MRREIGRAAEELAYALVGFAVLGVQRAQVVRRQIERCDAVERASGCLQSLVDRISGPADGTSSSRDQGSRD